MRCWSEIENTFLFVLFCVFVWVLCQGVLKVSIPIVDIQSGLRALSETCWFTVIYREFTLKLYNRTQCRLYTLFILRHIVSFLVIWTINSVSRDLAWRHLASKQSQSEQMDSLFIFWSYSISFQEHSELCRKFVGKKEYRLMSRQHFFHSIAS